ncbi:hypothetical protein [Rhodococcus pyridinivorans]|uniref:hypothetical protein n=1 Tax=Rhodococcus pyridinivorans TaxID=103816 RepID=UPI0022853538|nr:hypothetical protein [Rhodococcus pyridinivorans]WAL49950.1 hypothetical protein OQN32_28900 [Rhodococcus pyridinivorans]
MRFPMLLAAALVLPLTACGGSNAQPAPATADNSTAPIARYSNEATARYLSHLEHPGQLHRRRRPHLRRPHLPHPHVGTSAGREGRYSSNPATSRPPSPGRELTRVLEPKA